MPMLVVVYVLRCADGSYYVGNTRKPIEARIWEHNQGVVPGYTHSRRPVELAYAETTENLLDAFRRERQLKGWSRKKKEALMDQDWQRLSGLSQNSAKKRADTGDPEPRPSTSSG